MAQGLLAVGVAFLPVITLVIATCVVDDMQAQQDFITNDYMGKWYEVRYLPYVWEDKSQVYTDYFEDYTANEIGTEINYVSSGRFPDAENCQTGSGVLTINEHDPAKWRVDKYYNSSATVEVDYWIMNTDYDNYAYVYGCDVKKPDGTCEHAHAWVWSRTNNLTETQQGLIDGFITDSCLEPADFMILEQGKFCDDTSGAPGRLFSSFITFVILAWVLF